MSGARKRSLSPTPPLKHPRDPTWSKMAESGRRPPPKIANVRYPASPPRRHQQGASAPHDTSREALASEAVHQFIGVIRADNMAQFRLKLGLAADATKASLSREPVVDHVSMVGWDYLSAAVGRNHIATGWFPLGAAAACGRVEMAKILLDLGADMEQQMQHGETPLYLASQAGRLEVVKLLCERGCNAEAVNTKGASGICVAAENGHQSIVRFLVEHAGVSVHSQLHCGSSVLWLAAKRGDSEMLAFLLHCGARQTPNNNKDWPLHVAACRGHTASVRLLIANSLSTSNDTATAICNVHNKRGETAIFCTCFYYQALPRSDSLADILAALTVNELQGLLRKSNVRSDNASPSSGRRNGEIQNALLRSAVRLPAQEVTQLRVALREKLESVLTLEDVAGCRNRAHERAAQLETVKALVELGADVNATTPDGHTPIFIASQRGATEVVRFLTSPQRVGIARADLTLRPRPGGLTLLYIAAYFGHLEIVKILVEQAGVDVNEKTTQHQFTAIMPCSQEGHTPIVEYLINHGANIADTNSGGATALLFAAKNGQMEVARILLQSAGPRRADFANLALTEGGTPLYSAAERGHVEMVKLLLENGARVNDHKKNGASPLLVAVESGHIEIAECLINHGADTKQRLVKCGSSALHIGAMRGQIEFVEKALALWGFSATDVNQNGTAILHLAVQQGQREMVDRLVDNEEVDVMQLDGHRHSALKLAVSSSNPDAMAIATAILLASAHRAVEGPLQLRPPEITLPVQDDEPSNSGDEQEMEDLEEDESFVVDTARRSSRLSSPQAAEPEPVEELVAAEQGRHARLEHLANPFWHAIHDVPSSLGGDDGSSTRESELESLKQAIVAATARNDFVAVGEMAQRALRLTAEGGEAVPTRPANGHGVKVAAALPAAAASTSDMQEEQTDGMQIEDNLQALEVQQTVARKVKWLQFALSAFWPSRPRVLLTSPRENILQTLPRSGFLTMDIRAGLDVAFAGSHARGDGIRREWLELVSTQFMDPNVNLFRSRDGGRTFDPSPTAALTVPNHIDILRCIGRVVGIALLHGECLRHTRFSEPLLRQLLRQPLDLSSMERLDPELVQRKLQPILALPRDASPDEAELWLDGLTFTVDIDPDSSPCYFGQRRTVELIPGGAEKEVTLENKDQYVELLCRWYQRTETEGEIDSLVRGLWDVLPPTICESMAIVFDSEELSLLISGKEVFDLADWQKHAIFQGFTPYESLGILHEPSQLLSSSQCQHGDWLRRILEKGSVAFRHRLLCFVTGATTVPLGGFASITPPFTVSARRELSEDHLPSARTCLNCLYLPVYSSEARLEQALQQALDALDISA